MFLGGKAHRRAEQWPVCCHREYQNEASNKCYYCALFYFLQPEPVPARCKARGARNRQLAVRVAGSKITVSSAISRIS
jgi:hypothetical protein